MDAIKDNLLKKKSIRVAHREYGIDRITLTRHLKKEAEETNNKVTRKGSEKENTTTTS